MLPIKVLIVDVGGMDNHKLIWHFGGAVKVTILLSSMKGKVKNEV